MNLNFRLVNVDRTAAQQYEILNNMEKIDILVIPEPYLLKKNNIQNVPITHQSLVQEKIAVLYRKDLSVNVSCLTSYLISFELDSVLVFCAYIYPPTKKSNQN